MAFYPLANAVDLYDGYRAAFRVKGVELLLIQDDGRTYLIENRCPHMDAPLATGKIEAGAIVCRAHGIGFQLRDGKPLGPLADTLDCLRFFSLAYEGNKVGIDLP
jgi:nitrite reductase/ring-hydroxylating ferredoxin subunit